MENSTKSQNSGILKYGKLILILSILTAAIHFSRAAADAEIRTLFILNGLGYIGLASALLIPQFSAHANKIRWILMLFTAVTIAFYFVWVATSQDWTLPLGPIDKVIEIALLYFLYQSKPEAVA